MFNPLKLLIDYWQPIENDEWTKARIKYDENPKPSMSSYMKNYFARCTTTRTDNSIEHAASLHRQAMREGSTRQVFLFGLQDNWTAWQQPNGKIFYYNGKTNQTSWLAPTIPGWNQQF